MKLEDMRLPALQAKYKEAVGGPTKSPNKKFLIKRIKEALAARAKAKRAAKTAGAAPAADASIDELRARYEEEVGRPTTSADRAYLLWKIGMAKRGKIRVGPAREVCAGPVKILPLRLDEETVELVDAAWKRHGIKSRMAFLRGALHRELKALGEREAAARFAKEEA